MKFVFLSHEGSLSAFCSNLIYPILFEALQVPLLDTNVSLKSCFCRGEEITFRAPPGVGQSIKKYMCELVAILFEDGIGVDS